MDFLNQGEGRGGNLLCCRSRPGRTPGTKFGPHGACNLHIHIHHKYTVPITKFLLTRTESGHVEGGLEREGLFDFKASTLSLHSNVYTLMVDCRDREALLPIPCCCC